MSDKLSNKRLVTSSATVVISLALVLFMLGLLGLVVIYGKKLSNHVKENIGFQVILKDTITNAELDLLKQELSSSPFTKHVDYISKDEAAEKLKKDLGEDFISFLGYNPLLSSLDVKLNAEYANTDSLAGFEKELLQKHYVKEVIYHKDMVKQLNQNARVIAICILVLTVLLLVVAVVLINNTIRLSIYSKRFLLRTQYLVGATKGFIQKPFIYKGIRQGLISGIIAVAAVCGFLVLLTSYIPELKQLQDENILAALFGLIILVGIIISGLSAALSVNRYLRLKTEDLYF
ncbi:MAG: cell division protein FtsX [Bacteroidetes bacterium]|nr:cell division protein FtsX [Bacteroidota bacterium]